MLRYPQPDNEDAFEQMCLRFYRKLWKNENLTLYSKRGENQDGVDIHDPACLKPVRVVQCKHREATKTLSPDEIRKEVAKAEKSTLPIEAYVIATTAKKTKNAQDTVVALNRRPDSEKKFTVDLHFWEDICERLGQFTRIQAEFIIAEHDVAAEVLATILHDPSIASIATRLLAVTGGESSTQACDEIEQLLANRNFAAARHELDKLPRAENLKQLSAADQYKVLRFRGKLALDTGEFELASQFFLAAYEVQPELEQAKHNRVLAYSLVPDAAKAFSLACQYVAEGVATPLMLCRLVENASTLAQINERMALIEPHLPTDENLNIALSHKLLQLGEGPAAVAAAERAVVIAPESPHANLSAALAAHNAATRCDWRERKTRLQSALALYDKAATYASQKNFPLVQPEILINRAAVHMLRGDAVAANADYRAAVAVASRPAPYAACAVSSLLHQLDYASAAELLQSVDSSSDEGKFLVALTRFFSTDDREERNRCLDQLGLLANATWWRSVECRFHCINCAIELEDPGLALTFVTEAFQAEHPFQAFVALAWIEKESGDDAAALNYANKALEHGAANSHSQEVRLLAHVLTGLKQDVEAIDLLEQVATTGVFNDDTKAPIACAKRLERHDLLFRLCRELRETGEQDDRVRRLELHLLDQYAPEQAMALVDEFVRCASNPRYFVAFKNTLVIRLGRTDALDLEPAMLPTPAELLPRESRLVTLPFVTARRFDDALRFLYAQLRTHFDDEEAHGHYVSFFLTYGRFTTLRDPPVKVSDDCAVLLEVQGHNQRWVIIEDDKPVPTRNESSMDSTLVGSLIGKEVGDTAELPVKLVQREPAEIREIQTKYVRAFQDCVQHFRERFPNTSFIQPIHVGSGDAFDPTPLIENLKERRSFVEHCIEVYETNLCPLYLLANRLGITELDAVKALASKPRATIKCCETTPRDFEIAAQDGIGANLVVLSISAVVTITLADAWSYLAPKKTYIVSRSTRALVESWFRECAEEVSHEHGHASVTEKGQLVIQETTAEQRNARRAERESLRTMIETHCEVRSSEAVAAIAPEQRDKYEELVGFHVTVHSFRVDYSCALRA